MPLCPTLDAPPLCPWRALQCCFRASAGPIVDRPDRRPARSPTGPTGPIASGPTGASYPTGAPSRPARPARPAPATPLPGYPAVRLSGGPTRDSGTGKRSTPSGGRGATLPYPGPPNRPGGPLSAASGDPGARAPIRSTRRRRPGPSRGGPPLKLHCGQCSFNAGSMAIHPRRAGEPAACPALRAAGPDPDPPRFTRFVDTRSTDDVYRRRSCTSPIYRRADRRDSIL